MEKGRPREWLVLQDGIDFGGFNRVSLALLRDEKNKNASINGSAVVKVREVIPLTDDERRRVDTVRQWVNSENGFHADVHFLLSLLERAGLVDE